MILKRGFNFSKKFLLEKGEFLIMEYFFFHHANRSNFIVNFIIDIFIIKLNFKTVYGIKHYY